MARVLLLCAGMKTLIFTIAILLSVNAFAEEQAHVLTAEEYDSWVSDQKASGKWVEPKAPAYEYENRATAGQIIGAALKGMGQGLSQPSQNVNCVSNVVGTYIYTNCR